MNDGLANVEVRFYNPRYISKVGKVIHSLIVTSESNKAQYMAIFSAIEALRCSSQYIL